MYRLEMYSGCSSLRTLYMSKPFYTALIVRDRQTDRHRQTERQRQTDTDRQRDRQTRERDRQTGRDRKETEAERQTDRETDRQTERQRQRDGEKDANIFWSCCKFKTHPHCCMLQEVHKEYDSAGFG